MPLFGPPNVEKLKAKGDVKGLIKALGYTKDAGVRRAAAGALYGNKQAVGPLAAALEDENEDVRLAATQALGKIGEAAVEPLIAALEDESAYVRKEAARALGKIGDAQAVEPLIAALRDGDEWVVEAAAEALGRIGGAQAMESLIAALRDESAWVRKEAAKALEEIGSAQAVEPLIAALKDKEPQVRYAAAHALGKIGDVRAVEPLIEPALADEEKSVVRGAAEALGRIGDARAVQPLIAVLQRSLWKGQGGLLGIAAIEALAQIGDPRAVEPLIAASENEDMRPAAVEALMKFGDPRAVKLLIVIAEGSWGETARDAERTLWQIYSLQGAEAFVAALKDRELQVREAAAKWLDLKRWQPDRDEIGAAYWAAKRQWDRCIEIGAAAVEPLIVALGDADENVRKLAARALGKIGDQRAVEPLIAALRDGNEWVRGEAAGALGQLSDPRALEPLIAALGDRSKRVREHSVKALGQIGEPAVEPLLATLNYGGPLAREEAAEALDGLGWQPDRGEAGAAYWAAKHQWDRCVEIGEPAVEPLIATLNYGGALARMGAAKALDELGWQPGKDEAGAAYWALQGRWDRCVEIGGPAVEPLIVALSDESKHVRCSAAEALVEMYASGELADAQKRSILAQRSKITRSHRDGRTHHDGQSRCSCHIDTDRHEDAGIGVDFPL